MKKTAGVLVVRNASGSPAGNIFDIVALDSLLGISEVIIVKHTGEWIYRLIDSFIH